MEPIERAWGGRGWPEASEDGGFRQDQKYEKRQSPGIQTVDAEEAGVPGTQWEGWCGRSRVS